MDFSTKDENRISVKFSGWPDGKKDSLMQNIKEIEGVIEVQSAGGKTSAYVYFEPKKTNRESLEIEVRRLVEEIGVNYGYAAPKTPNVIAKRYNKFEHNEGRSFNTIENFQNKDSEKPGKTNNYVDEFMNFAKSYKLFAFIIIIFLAVIAVGNFTDALDKILRFIRN